MLIKYRCCNPGCQAFGLPVGRVEIPSRSRAPKFCPLCRGGLTADIMPGRISQQQIQAVLRRYPGLDDQGFTLRSGKHKIPFSIPEVERALYFCESCGLESKSTFCRVYNSYILKHMAEPVIGYVSNGAFILGAILAGFRAEPVGFNAHLNTSLSSIKDVRDRLGSKARLEARCR